MIPKKITTMFSQDPDVWVKCSVIRALLQPRLDLRVLLGGVVIQYNMQFHPQVLLSRPAFRNRRHSSERCRGQEASVTFLVVTFNAANNVVVPAGSIGKIGAVRSTAWIWDYSPIERTTAFRRWIEVGTDDV